MAQTREVAAAGQEAPRKHQPLGISDQEMIDFYKRLVTIRTLDERVWALNRQGKVPIVASSQGHEAAEMGSVLAAHKDGDCFLFPYYRCLALKVMAGLTTLEAMLSYMGKQGDIYSGGRQFPLQGADVKHKVIQISNVVAAGMTQAVGYALACKRLGDTTVVLSYFGDGASSQGECHEAMNFAGVHKLPVIFICENNRYAISVPQKKQMAIQDVAERAAGYGFPGFVVDGMDFFQVFEATEEAIVHARSQGPGPAGDEGGALHAPHFRRRRPALQAQGRSGQCERTRSGARIGLLPGGRGPARRGGLRGGPEGSQG